MTAPHRRSVWLDALDAQMETWRWVRTEMGKDWVRARNEQVMELEWDIHEEGGGGDDALVEQNILLRAEPFFISEEMCVMTAAACESFTMHEPLLPSDLLATHGFVYFEKGLPLEGNNHDPGLPILGFAWGVNAVDKPAGIFPTLYTDWPETWGQPRSELPSLPRLIPTPLPMWLFGEEPPRLRDGLAVQYVALQVTLKLLLQFIPRSRYSKREAPDRIVRREAKKLAFPERDVVVVRLRRERSESEPSGSEANYSHRFYRSGHWRNQWYPSLHTHRQKWIHPTIVGPSHLPLRANKRRVFVFDR